MHNLLKRQLKKHFGSDQDLPEELKAFVAAVNESYQSFDSDQKILHRAMELSSQELAQANSELRAVFQAIPDLILKIDRAGNIVALKATEEATEQPVEDRFKRRKISSKLSELTDPAIREQFRQALEDLFGDRQPKTFEYSSASELGDNCFEVRLVPLLEDGAIAIVQDITARKQANAEYERINQQLIAASRQAGMAEVATGVLHNVGNVLNSVNVSASVLRESLGKSQIPNLLKATNLMREHANAAAEFFTNDPKGQRLPGYLIKLGEHIAAEQSGWERELDDLGRNIEHIKEVVAMQQNFARLSGLVEVINARELVEDAVRVDEVALRSQGITLIRDFQDTPSVEVDKHKVLQILINLIRNARHAMSASNRVDKNLSLSIRSGDGHTVSIQVGDNGIGIAAENLTRIFQHGFTTKHDGHGFGLHSGANAAREMGGKLTVHSAGPGLGAAFTLELPCESALRPNRTVL